MAVTPIWTAHCDRCCYWDDHVMGDKRADVVRAAKRRGWLVTRDLVLCPDCRRESEPSEGEQP